MYYPLKNSLANLNNHLEIALENERARRFVVPEQNMQTDVHHVPVTSIPREDQQFQIANMEIPAPDSPDIPEISIPSPQLSEINDADGNQQVKGYFFICLFLIYQLILPRVAENESSQ